MPLSLLQTMVVMWVSLLAFLGSSPLPAITLVNQTGATLIAPQILMLINPPAPAAGVECKVWGKVWVDAGLSEREREVLRRSVMIIAREEALLNGERWSVPVTPKVREAVRALILGTRRYGKIPAHLVVEGRGAIGDEECERIATGIFNLRSPEWRKLADPGGLDKITITLRPLGPSTGTGNQREEEGHLKRV